MNRPHRRDIDDFTISLLFHIRNDGPAAKELALQVNVDNPVPVRFGDVIDSPAAGEKYTPGVIDQDIDLAELFDGPGYHIAHLGAVGNIGGDRQRPASQPPDLLRDPGGAFRMQGVDDNVTTFAGELQGYSPPDSLAPTGNDSAVPLSLTAYTPYLLA